MEHWELWTVAVAVIVLLAAVMGGVYLLPWLARKIQGYPREEEIEAALLPVLYQAICTAYKLSERAVDELGVRMQGVDKAVIAATVYEALPDPVQTFVSPEQWTGLVDKAFAEFLEFYQEVAGHLEGEFNDWADAWHPARREEQQ